MFTTVIISLLMAVAFPAAVIIREKELPDSISALVRYLPRNYQWVWSVWLLLCGGIPSACLIEVLPDFLEYLGFITLVCIGFTAAMPIIYKEQYKAHNIFGTSACVVSQMCVLFLSPWWLLAWPIGVIAYLTFSTTYLWEYIKDKEILLAEMVCGITVFGSLIEILVEKL